MLPSWCLEAQGSPTASRSPAPNSSSNRSHVVEVGSVTTTRLKDSCSERSLTSETMLYRHLSHILVRNQRASMGDLITENE
jgi:hypothetical protein